MITLDKIIIFFDKSYLIIAHNYIIFKKSAFIKKTILILRLNIKHNHRGCKSIL